MYYTKADKLNPVVGSRTDLVVDYSHIEQFGQAITQLSSLDISNCNFTSASIKIFTSSVSWAKAALAHLVICQNKIGPEGGTALVEAIKTSNLEYISIGKDLTLPIKGELDSPTLDASDQDIDPGYVIILAWWLTTPAGAAAVAHISISGNMITGSTNVGSRSAKYDVDLSKASPRR